MLVHCVFCDFRDEVTEAEIGDVFGKLASLVQEIAGMLDFEGGPNLDFERKSPRYRHGFVCRFEDRAAHLRYEAHPVHVEAGQALIGLCRGGYEGIVVFDLVVS